MGHLIYTVTSDTPNRVNLVVPHVCRDYLFRFVFKTLSILVFSRNVLKFL